MSAHGNYRSDIDGLRAVAVLSVLVFHAAPTFLPGGFVGVDIFFVISGYLISGILFQQFEKRSFTYSKFYARRVRRIFPALVTVLVAVVVGGWFSLKAHEYELLGKHIFASVLFFQNINLLRESGYFDVTSDLKPLLHLWSLAIEEQFYLVWPILIALTRGRARILFCVLLFFLTTSFAMNLLRVERHPDSAFYEIQFRLWELMAGALLILLETTRTRVALSQTFRRFFNRNVRSVLGFALCIIAFIFIGQDKNFPGFWALLPVVGTTLLISARGGIVNNWLSKPLLVWIGLISYPLYLWHWPLLSFARTLAPNMVFEPVYCAVVRGICVVLAFVASWLTYKWIEQPLRNPSVNARMKLALLCLLFVTLGLGGVLVEMKHGYPFRNAAKTIEPDIGQDIPLIDCSKSIALKGVEWCKTNHSGENADVVIIGDSHAINFAGVVENSSRFKGRTLDVMASGTTIGLLGTATVMAGGPSTNGKRNLDAAFQWALDHHAKTVILVSRGPIYYTGRGSGLPLDPRHLTIADLQNPSEADQRVIFQTGLRRTLQMLTSHSIETIFVYDNPELDFFPQENCIERPVHLPGALSLNPCGVSLAKVRERQADYRKAVESTLTEFPKVQSFDPLPSLCEHGECLAMRGMTLLYTDNQHLSPAGALWLSQFLK